MARYQNEQTEMLPVSSLIFTVGIEKRLCALKEAGQIKVTYLGDRSERVDKNNSPFVVGSIPSPGKPVIVGGRVCSHISGTSALSRWILFFPNKLVVHTGITK